MIEKAPSGAQVKCMTKSKPKSICLVEWKSLRKSQHLGKGIGHLFFACPTKANHRLLSPAVVHIQKQAIPNGRCRQEPPLGQLP
jgi:hypothetical protein